MDGPMYLQAGLIIEWSKRIKGNLKAVHFTF